MFHSVGAALMIPYLILVPETRSGVLLARRARRLRKETGNHEYFAEHEVVRRYARQTLDVANMIRQVGRRNWKQVCRETLVRPVCKFLSTRFFD